VVHERSNNIERDLDSSNLENLKLKGLNFELDLKV